MSDKFIAIPATVEEYNRLSELDKRIIGRKLDCLCRDKLDKGAYLTAIGCEKDLISLFVGITPKD